MALLRRSRPDPGSSSCSRRRAATCERAGAAAARPARRTIRSAPDLARELVLCEHEGDRIAHDIIHRLNAPTPRAAASDFDSATATSWRPRSTTSSTSPSRPPTTSGSTGSRRRWSRRSQMADVLVGAGEQVAARAARAAQRRATSRRTSSRSTASRTRATASAATRVASLFANGIDPMVVIRWKDIFASLEAASTPASTSRTCSRASRSSAGAEPSASSEARSTRYAGRWCGCAHRAMHVPARQTAVS